MIAFAALLDRLILTPSRNEKLRVLTDYFRTTPDPDRGWALASISGALELPSVKPAAVRELMATRVDPQLFAMSYDYVGDLAETISLLWPAKSGANAAPTLGTVVDALSGTSRPQALQSVERWLDALPPPGRWALIKLVTGGLRIGVSARLAKQAAADLRPVDVSEIDELWHGLTPPYAELFAWLADGAERPTSAAAAPFRPVMLAQPLFEKSERLDGAAPRSAEIDPGAFAAEWKWDGVRVQAVAQGGVRRLFTRTGDDIGHAFPDILESLCFEGAIDGELLVRSPAGAVAPFNELQRRMNRKTPSARDRTDRPAFIRAYDLLVDNADDLRSEPFRMRRRRLETLVASLRSDRLDLSPLLPFGSMEALDALRRSPPIPEIEGVMLKRWDSCYVAGRPRGPWFKWKRDPYSVDAVLMYAQRGHGRRATFYSDFTFGVWRSGDAGEELTPVGKAYFGFTDEELSRLDRYVRDNTTERFGPVRAVTAGRDRGLVLEIAFEGLQRSPRHKSGVAMRFPRIQRIRWDKPPSEADRIETLEQLLTIDPTSASPETDPA
ncbi:cisplatin damage response ATP-dependent DNA ligase [bacterium]|nr:cisplatin damage response ATP-dependent DNA ligase [bacterium]